MSPKRKSAGKKAAQTRKRRAAGKKAAASRKHRAASTKAAKTKKHRAAGTKAAATRATKKQEPVVPPPTAEETAALDVSDELPAPPEPGK